MVVLSKKKADFLRVWEKIREALLEVGKASKGLKKALATWAKKQAAAAANERQLGGNGTQTVSYLIAKKLLSKGKQGLGLDPRPVCATAAARRVDACDRRGCLCAVETKAPKYV